MSAADLDAGAVIMHPGLELSVADANIVARRSPTRLVVLAGLEESGKTTILTSIYEQFRLGTIDRLRFAGSESLLGLEQRCFLSRISSGAEAANTDRTRQKDARFIHFAMQAMDSDSFYEMLFTDISGEAFRLARDFEDDARHLEFVRRADHFALILDGERIADLSRRANVVSTGRGILKRFIGLGMLGRSTEVEIVTTKLDAIMVSEAADASLGFLTNVEKRLTDDFGSAVGDISAFRVAARPVSTGLGEGYGIPELLDHWAGSRRFCGLGQSTPSPQPALGYFDAIRPFTDE